MLGIQRITTTAVHTVLNQSYGRGKTLRANQKTQRRSSPQRRPQQDAPNVGTKEMAAIGKGGHFD